MHIRTARRYFLRKSQDLYLMEFEGLAAAYRSKHDAQPGTALPVDFPHAATLTAARYTAREDLDGADLEELTRFTKLSIRDARAVLAAFAALP